jgi:SRSO17 transposase
MTSKQVQDLTPAFADFLQPFLFCCGYTQTFDLLGVYCRGLLSDLPRKTAEPIALASGTAVRTLQEFLHDHVWDYDQVRGLLQQHIALSLTHQSADDLGTVGIADETGTAKRGSKTPGVQRQYCGELGKIENCIVTVHLGVSRGRYKTLVDSDLFLPEAWEHDRERCRAAGIPNDLHYRPKWQIVLEQLDRSRANHINCDWLTFDENYGEKPDFLTGLDERKQRYVGEVPKSMPCFRILPRGRRPRRGWAGHRADDLVRYSPVFRRQSWLRVRLARQTLGPQVWEVKTAQVWLARGRRPTPRTYWLIVARNVATGEVKYFVSNAPRRASWRRLLRVAFCRWNVEHVFRVSKSEIGFRHFEGRNYVGLMRHLVLCLVTLTFVAEQTERLRGEKKSGDNAGASVPGPEPAVYGVVGGTAGDGGRGAHSVGHKLLSAA